MAPYRPWSFPLGLVEVVSLLGAGGRGHVLRARDTKLGRGVALDVSPDGETFVMVEVEPPVREFPVVLNWIEELRRRRGSRKEGSQ